MATIGLDLTPEYLIQVGNTVTLTYDLAGTAGAPYVWTVWGETVPGCITLSQASGNTVKVTANAVGTAYINVTIGAVSGNFFVQSTLSEIVAVYQPDKNEIPKWIVGPQGGDGDPGNGSVEGTGFAHVTNGVFDENARNPTAAEVGLGNVTNDAQIRRSEMGVANGVATLDSSGKLTPSQGAIPSKVSLMIWS